MPSLETSPQPGTQAPAPITALIETMLTTGARLCIAIALGLFAARLMRRRGLHWSWGAVALLVTFLLRGALGGLALPLALGALVASLRGRRGHRRDLEAGADVAARARERLSPCASARVLVARASLYAGDRWSLRSGHGHELILGRGPDGRAVSIPFGEDAGRHTLVVGATGSGKTVTQTLMAVGAIERGLAAIVVDPKGDRGMRDRIRDAAALHGREFLEWTPAGPSIYNPYARGGETQIADRLLAGERFTEPHYLRQAQRYLGHVIRALRAGGVAVSLESIVRHLDPGTLEELLRQVPEPAAGAGHAYLDSLAPRQLRDLAGVRDRLAILTESDVGPWLDPAGGQGASIDLLRAARSGAVVYFSLESDSRPLLAQMLGAAVVQDLQSTIAALQGDPAPTLVVIDEFSAVAAEQVVALFGRARSAGFSLLLGTQELSDLRLPGRERLLEQVVGNLSALLAHRQVVPQSAELIAAMGGLRGTWRTSFASDGRTTRTRVEEPLLAPDRLMRLEPGWCAVIALGSGAGARLTRIIPGEGGR
jgi:conjugal transfer pilus assembly protein TraD